jgi:Flp pilus assembly protein TadD
MSLLLQALQKAARSRESGPDEAPPAAPETVQEPSFDFDADPGPEEEPSAELELADDADLFEAEPPVAAEPIRPPPTRPSIASARAVTTDSGASAAYAATILRASEERGTGWLDWVRDRPVHTFAITAAVFLLGYGGYVYLQIFHPGILRGDFFNKPALKAKPQPPTSPISKAPPAAEPAPAPPPPAAAVELEPATASRRLAAEASKAITGLPQAPSHAAASPDPPAAGPGKGAGVRTERTRSARTPREAPPRRQVAPAEPTGLEDTVAVRQPEAPAATAANLLQAWEALQRGQFAQAQALYEKVEQAEPQSVDALLGLAAIAAQRGNTELAARQYSRVLELDPRDPTAQAGLISLLGQADPQMSESRLKQLIAREPSANLYFALGNLYARSTQWAQAQQAYFQAYQLKPDNPDYAYNLAVGLEHLSQPKLALTYYRQALELGNLKGHTGFDSARVQERIGQLTARTGDR